MNIDPGVIYIFISATLGMNAWALKEVIGLRSRMHRLEAREPFLVSKIDKLEQSVEKVVDTLNDHHQHNRRDDGR